MMARSKVVLRVSGLRAAQAGVEVVTGFDLEVSQGEVMGILGPNGAGKSTAVDAICGFVEKRAGSVMFEDRDVTGYPPYELARLGLIQVSQTRDLFPNMSVQDNLTLGSEALRRRRSDAIPMGTVLEIFPRLQQRLNQSAGSLSGGEQQMLAIARALAGGPKVLLLDEPSAGLAPVIVDQIVELMRKLTGKGLTLVLVEQNVGVALGLCDRFVVLKGGRIVFEGDKSQLGDRPREFLARLYL